MTHTPGPWKVSCTRTRLGREPVIPILGGDDRPYAFVLYGDGSDKQHHTAYADARLIAAAPDMLEALESLFDAVDSCVELTPKVMEQARAAIAKARGQS